MCASTYYHFNWYKIKEVSSSTIYYARVGYTHTATFTHTRAHAHWETLALLLSHSPKHVYIYSFSSVLALRSLSPLVLYIFFPLIYKIQRIFLITSFLSSFGLFSAYIVFVSICEHWLYVCWLVGLVGWLEHSGAGCFHLSRLPFLFWRCRKNYNFAVLALSFELREYMRWKKSVVHKIPRAWKTKKKKSREREKKKKRMKWREFLLNAR